MAETIQLVNEHDPHLFVNAGSPLTAPTKLVQMVRAIAHDGVANLTAAAERAAKGIP